MIQPEPDDDLIVAPIPERLTRADAAAYGASISRQEARWLVDTYYQIQDFRKASANQVRASHEAGEPSTALLWTQGQMRATEAGIVKIMDAWTDSLRAGRWAKSQVGIGPVLAAGVVATFDDTKPTVGAWWRFAGLDPTLTWGKGEKRPFSAQAKVLAWKIGDSFVKVSGRDDAFYGKLYRQRKAYEIERDLAGGNADAAARTLEAKKITDKPTRTRYESGHLPDGRIDLRARRWAVKMFLAHLHWVMWEARTGSPPVNPYALDILHHVHLIAPPGWPCE
jgi:hypothetical protein